MRRLLRAAARLYPRAWRNRYGDEFDALIDDMTPRSRDVFNILIGALIMQLSRLSLVPVALALAGGVAGAAVSLAMPAVYASSSRVLVQVPEGDRSGDRAQRIRTAIEGAMAETTLDKKKVSVTLRGEPSGQPVLLEVSASGATAEAAKHATEQALSSIIEANLAASEKRAEASTNPATDVRNSHVQFRIIDAASLPTDPQRETKRGTVLGGALGLAAGAVIVLVARRRRP